MKRQPRLQLLRTWRIYSALSFALFLLVALAAVAPWAAAVQLDGLIRKLPLVTTVVDIVPRGTSPVLQIPWEMITLILAIIPLWLCTTRYRHHKERFADEEKERDLKDV